MSTAASDPGTRALAALDRLGGSYERIEVDPALADTAAFCKHYGYPLEISGNTILVVSKRGEQRFCACLVLATTRLDINHTVRPLLGTRKASFASAEETAELTGMLIGGGDAVRAATGAGDLRRRACDGPRRGDRRRGRPFDEAQGLARGVPPHAGGRGRGGPRAADRVSARSAV